MSDLSTQIADGIRGQRVRPLRPTGREGFVRAAWRMPQDEGLEFEKTWFGLLFSTEDMAEGVSAFLEKRPAEFKGR